MDFLKLSFHGAFLPNEGLSSIGGIFRNHIGLPLLAYADKVTADSPIAAEIHALHQGLILAATFRLRNFLIEGDCANIFNTIN